MTAPVKSAVRHLMQAATNASSPAPTNDSSSWQSPPPAGNDTANGTQAAYQYDVPTNYAYVGCQSCNQLPTWVYDSITPSSVNTTANDSSLAPGSANSTANDSASSPPKLEQPSATLPLLHVRRFDAFMNDSFDITYLPAEAVRIAARKVWAVSGIELGTAQLPAEFGCPGWVRSMDGPSVVPALEGNTTCRVDAQVSAVVVSAAG